MSEINELIVNKDTVKKLKFISKSFGSLNTGAVGDEFWLYQTEGGDGYDWEQTDFGINKKGEFITCRQSGCSCYGPENPTADKTLSLNQELKIDVSDCYDSDFSTFEKEFTAIVDTVYQVLKDKDVSFAEVIALPNAEIRRAVIEFIGLDSLMEKTNVTPVDTSTFGDLIRVSVLNDEDIVVVKVQDSSTDRKYFLRVPPTVKTAKEAVAWTFNLTENDYNPSKET